MTRDSRRGTRCEDRRAAVLERREVAVVRVAGHGLDQVRVRSRQREREESAHRAHACEGTLGNRSMRHGYWVSCMCCNLDLRDIRDTQKLKDCSLNDLFLLLFP